MKKLLLKISGLTCLLGLLQINTALIAQIGTGYDYAPSYVNVTGGGSMPSTADGYVCDCDGTGATDATACLQAALNTAANQNKPLLIPATSNYYLVNGTLMVNCSVIGINGMPTLRQTTTAEFTPVLRLVNNMTGWINNLHIIGSYSGSGDGTTEYNHLVNLGGVNGVTVSGNLLEKALGDCVTDNAQEQDANAARNVLVTGNTMLNPWRCNVSFNNVADRWAVMNNYMTYYTSYVNPVDLEPWRSVAYVTNVEVGYNDIQSPNPKWEDANHFYDAVVKVTAYFDNTPGGNVYIHHNYGDWGVPIFNETGYQGGPSTWFNVVSTNNAEGTEPPGTSGDTAAPSVPTGLASSSVGETSFTLSWSASSDNVGVTEYEVFSNNISVGTTSNTSLNISGLSCGSSYAMKVSARDAAGNLSAQSAAKNVTTLACSGNTSVITFEDRPTDETELTGTYAGVDWGTSGWATYQETGVSPATKVLEMYTNNTAEETKTFTIPSGKVLKSLKIGAFSNPSTKKIVLSSPGNTTRTWTDMTAELNTYKTNWTTAASVITVKITSSAGASFIVMDDITYETVTDDTPPPPTTSGTGLASAVFSNKTLSGSPVATGTDAQVNFDWKTGGKVSGLIDNFSVRWTGEVQPQYSQQYTFYTQADDGTRLWVNGQLLIDDWTNHAVREVSGKITLEAGKKYSIKLEYFENAGGAVCRLLWSSSSRSKQIIPQARLYPVAGSQPSATNYTIRARGVQGTEQMALQIGGQTVKSWTVSTSMQDYSYSGSQTGSVRVAITNDQGANHDLRIDKLTVDGTTYQAEAQAVNTGVWQNGSCGGSNSEWLHCSGYIQFELGAANARQDDQTAKQSLGEEPLPEALIYPNPSVGGNFSVRGITDVSRVQMYDLTGREVKLRAEKVGAHYQMQPQGEVPQGMYIIQLQRDDNQQKQYKLLVQ